MTPSIGRIVHYVSYGTTGGEYPSVCRAAVITAWPERVEDGNNGAQTPVSSTPKV